MTDIERIMFLIRIAELNDSLGDSNTDILRGIANLIPEFDKELTIEECTKLERRLRAPQFPSSEVQRILESLYENCGAFFDRG